MTAGAAGQERTETIAPEPAAALAGVLDLDAVPDDVLPPLWHWVYLLEKARERELADDGHAVRGLPSPPGPGYRRMVGGGRVDTHGLLRIGRPATRTTTLLRTVEKQGRSGPLVISTVGSRIRQDGRLIVADEQDIVYRAPRAASHPSGLPAAPSAAPPAPPPAAQSAAPPAPPQTPLPAGQSGLHATPPRPDQARAEPSMSLRADERLLFRFSALTYNAHRIHYDIAWCMREGYGGLVIHGPLQALLMGELMRRHGVSLVGRRFAYRFVAPLTGVQDIRVAAGPHGLDAGATVTSAAGVITASATLT